MVQKLRERSQGEGGFTLVELLVVMLILGLLAAIAIPSFFNQREKAKDADAKAAARTAQTAIETYATGNQGDYTGATAGTATDDLNVIEPTLNDSTVEVLAADENSYTVEVTSEGSAANRVPHHSSLGRDHLARVRRGWHRRLPGGRQLGRLIGLIS